MRKVRGTGVVLAPSGTNLHHPATLRWVPRFLIIALIAAVFSFSFTGIASSAAGVAKVLFFIFLVLVVLSMLFGKRIWKDVP